MNNVNSYSSESLIAREIRQAKEKEDEWKRQRHKCGLADDMSMSLHSTDSNSMDNMKSRSFLSNLDFFNSKLNNGSNESMTLSRRSLVNNQHQVHDAQNSLTNSTSRLKTNSIAQDIHRTNGNDMSIVRTSSANTRIYRSSSSMNINATNNIVQREIQAIRAKEAELRELGRIQRTSDEHSDPRKYHECVTTLPKSQSIQTIASGKIRRDSGNQPMLRQHAPLTTSVHVPTQIKVNHVHTGRMRVCFER
jgi:hypothetical protein